MKKTQILFLVLAILTALSGCYMIYANVSIQGYHLLEMDAAAGAQVVAMHRISILIFVVLLLLTLLTGRLMKKKKRRGMVCENCGAACGQGEKFCRYCGTPFS